MTALCIDLATLKFPLGDVVITTNAQSRIDPVDRDQGLCRHARGDWGELCEEDRVENERALRDGGRLMSVYRSGDECFWIITECDRSVTTILLPLDY